MPGITHRARRHLGVVLAALATALAMAAAISPAAAGAVEYRVTGTGGLGLNVRATPGLSAGLIATLADGTAVNIICQTRGDQVAGSTMWDKIDSPATGYIADWYTTTPAVNAPSPGLPECTPPQIPRESEPAPAEPGLSNPQPPSNPEPQPQPNPENPTPQPEPNIVGAQQIVLYTPSDQSASICGTNQHEQHVCHVVQTPGYGHTRVANWWWTGGVTIYNYADTNAKTHYLGSTTCDVPIRTSSQWTQCNGVPARGNENKHETHRWGMRIWLRHTLAESTWRSVQASGSFAGLDRLPLPGPVSWIVRVALKDPACIGRFVNELGARDAGYGVVMDVNWWAPFWACGSLKVWAQ